MAVHSAAMAGNADIVRIILEADNMVDLNTPTYQTKETLAHLAVKHGHRNVFKVLEAFGADLTLRDGEGRRICDVTRDRKWSRQVEAHIANCFGDNPDGDRRRNAILHPKNTRRTARMRKSDTSQQEKNLNAREYDGVKAATGSHTKKKSKKKGKKGKKNKQGNIEDANKEAIITAVSTMNVDVGAAEASLLFKRLLMLVGSDIDQTPDPENVTQLEASLVNMATMVFSRFRDPKIPACDNLTTCSITPVSRDHVFRSFAGIHMKEKLYGVDHTAITVPAIAPVLGLCDTNSAFAEFVIATARIGTSIDCKTQVRELLDLLETRLLNVHFINQKALGYRELVQEYSTARVDMGFGADFELQYISRYITESLGDYELQSTFDGMDGRLFYFDIVTTSTDRFHEFEHAVETDPVLETRACFEFI